MEDKYYSPEDYIKLCAEVKAAENALKYILAVPLDNPDSKLNTFPMLMAMDELSNACESLVRSFDFYMEAEYYLCKNDDEVMKKVIAATAQAINKDSPQLSETEVDRIFNDVKQVLEVAREADKKK